MEENTRYAENRTDERVVKIPLPISLIRDIDEAIVAGLGGYSTRTEFFRDAAEGLLFELKYEPAPAEPPAASARAVSPAQASKQQPAADRLTSEHDVQESEATAVSVGLESTVLRLTARGAAMEDGEAEVSNQILFGLHNRDYPSLWVAHQLAKKLDAGAVPYEAFVDEVTATAWDYAESLRALEASAGPKVTALFPTNRQKPQSASEGFRTFAIGSVSNATGNGLRADGPLFTWRLAQVKRLDDDGLVVGLTDHGWDLLQRLDGLSLALPHATEHAHAFLAHLAQRAPADWWGFRTVLDAVAEGPTRSELVEAFRSARPDWSPAVAATNAQGYLARGREWGLIAAKQVSGTYLLTDFGSTYLEEITRGTANGDTFNGNARDV
jgi:hypothetical protein